MLDNLFIVESPLQALVAAELSLQLKGQSNGVIYLLSGEDRERNNQQIISVIEHGDWFFTESVRFSNSSGLLWFINCRRYVSRLKIRFRGKVKNLFFGEFRSQWMHLARFSIAPEKYILLDDGAATLTVKAQFIDKGIFYPKQAWSGKSRLKQLVKDAIFLGLTDNNQGKKNIYFASAFLKEDSEYKIDFSLIRDKVSNSKINNNEAPRAYFFGSKYSEAGIVTRNYELEFLSEVFSYYRSRNLDCVYCAHRDESEEKLKIISNFGNVEVIRPGLPAELFVLQHDQNILEIGAAYSSVINNLRLIFPDKAIVSFRIREEEINKANINSINKIYSYFDDMNIPIVSF